MLTDFGDVERLVGRLPEVSRGVRYGHRTWSDDHNFVKLTSASIWETRQTEFAKEISPVPEGWSRYGNTVVGPPGEDWTHLRIVVERLTGSE